MSPVKSKITGQIDIEIYFYQAINTTFSVNKSIVVNTYIVLLNNLCYRDFILWCKLMVNYYIIELFVIYSHYVFKFDIFCCINVTTMHDCPYNYGVSIFPAPEKIADLAIFPVFCYMLGLGVQLLART